MLLPTYYQNGCMEFDIEVLFKDDYTHDKIYTFP